MEPFYVKPGDRVTFSKTVGETDVYLFAGITGDFSVNHVNEQYMARTKYGHRIAHGALIVGYMSTCSTMMIERCKSISLGERRFRSATTRFDSSEQCSSETRSRSLITLRKSTRRSGNRLPISVL